MTFEFKRPNKILCILLAATICITSVFVSVSAEDYTGLAGIAQNDVNYIKQTLENAKKLVNGEITVQDAFYSQMSNASDLVSQNVKDINPFQSETELTGVTNRDYANKLTKSVRDCLDTHGIDYGKTEVTEDVVDMKGYGAVLVCSEPDGYTKYQYGEYGYVNSSSYRFHNIAYYENYRYGNLYSSGFYSSVTSDLSDLSGKNTYTFYGDWRNFSDGQPAIDKTTPTQNTIQSNDPSTLTDTQLIDLLEDLLLNLKLDFPDLSSVEGLLSAILTKLGTLDSDNDNGLLSDIYVAIQSLKTDSHPESQQIIVLLEEIRDNLTGTSSGSGETSDLTELTDILKDMKKSLNYLVGIETIDVVTDAIDLDNIDVTEFDQKFFDKYGSLITTVINKFGYGPVNEMLKTCHSIVFNTSAPADLTINYEGVDYTILSSTMFNDDKVKSSLTLVKSFLSIFILIGWLTVMRRRITSAE